MKIGILAVQGAFLEHRKKLEALGAQCVEIRQKGDLQEAFDGLVLPGGESTVQGKLLRELDIFEGLKERIIRGIPVLATCAGLILLAEACVNDPHVYFGTLPVTVKRNAYGRQLGSFSCKEDFAGREITQVFIRAPYIEKVLDDECQVLSQHEGFITGVRYKNQLAAAFHPELTDDRTVHQYFLDMISGK